MHDTKRSLAFWLIIGFLSVALVLLLMGQTMALVDYDLAVQLGLQESVNEVGGYGIQVNRAFGAGDTIVYIPLITLSIIGLIVRKRWSLLTTAAAMGISAYWATTIASMLFFLPGAPATLLSRDWNTGYLWPLFRYGYFYRADSWMHTCRPLMHCHSQRITRGNR